jgi:MoxR-like ATPase
MPTRTLNVLLGVMSRRAIVLTEHGSEEVEAAEGFQVIMAMNLGQGYSVNNIDRALINRFEAILEYKYLPEKEERDLLIEQTGVSTQLADIMIKVANDTRALRKQKELSTELTPRSLRSWATKYVQRTGRKDGWPSAKDLKESANVTWIPQVVGTDSDGYIKTDGIAKMLVLIEGHTPTNPKGDVNQESGGVDPIESFRKAHTKVT